MKIAKTQKITKDIEPYKVDEMFDSLFSFANKNISFEDNIQNQIFELKFSANDEELTVRHDLGRVPYGFLQLDSTGTGVLYRNETWARNDKQFKIKASAAGTYRVMII